MSCTVEYGEGCEVRAASRASGKRCERRGERAACCVGLFFTQSSSTRAGGTRPPSRCAEVVEHILESEPHPEQGYRSCLGLIRLGNAYGEERVETACARVLALDICSYRSISSMLKDGLESRPLPDSSPVKPRPNTPPYVRGATYYS